jgi:hypothetical protein
MAGASEEGNERELAQLASETVAPIAEELHRRLDAPIGDRDRLAIESALLKAFIGGMHAAAAETVEAAIQPHEPLGGVQGETASVSVQPGLASAGIDPWAERYGDGP